MSIELVGWIGATAFALSGFPQMVKSVREGHSYGVSYGLIWLWLIGEGAMFGYALLKYADAVLLVNYAVNFIVVAIIGWYKYRPRRPHIC